MTHQQALAMARFVVDETPRPVSVFVADTHGEVVVAITMDGAAHDTRLNARRKAYTAARSHLHTSGALGDSVRDDPVDRASFDPFFTFFRGGVAVFADGCRVGAVAVSGLTGEEDETLALRAIDRAGLSGPPAG
jgi:glc operon protein GlcG